MFLNDQDLKKIKHGLSKGQKIQLLSGMMLTRACDNALKYLFLTNFTSDQDRHCFISEGKYMYYYVIILDGIC